MSPDPGNFVVNGETGDKNGFPYETVAQMYVVVDGPNGRTAYGPYHNEAWSPIRNGHRVGGVATGGQDKIELKPGETVKYVVKLRPGNTVTNSTVLLATPVLDDVTLFFEYGIARYISYVELREL
jgi:hypothetical protein